MGGRIIGIDLGTTNSCVSVVENGEAVIIPSNSGSRTTPSIVAFSKAGERLVGEKAKRQAVTNPDRTILSIKREMGSDWVRKIDGVEYRPQTISALLLMQLKEDAERFLGEEVSDAVITVPAYFNDVQRQATKDAGRIAGLNVRRIINEPTSAALSYGLNHAEPQKIMVYDLGGGTFDVSVIEISEGTIEVLSTAGDNHLGGDDFDDRLTDYLVREFRKENGVDLSRDIFAMQRVREAAEQVKMELSASMRASVNIPFITQSRGIQYHLDVTISREQFVGLIRDLIDRTEGPVRSALADAGISAAKLAKVLLVGGSTRIPAVQEKIYQMTGIAPSRNINPDECVALGAAIQGKALEGAPLIARGTSEELLLFDVTPLSLSIETVGGIATTLIRRNSTIPTKFSKIFSTAAPFQRTVEINVLQGERPMARDNKSIGKFRLKGIKPAPAGVPQIEVTFDIDVNGILKVTAKDLDTGREQSVTITANDRMSESEIQEAMRFARQYAQVDSLRKEALQEMDESSKLLVKVRNSMKTAGKEIDREEKKILTSDIKELERVLGRCKVDRVTQEEIQSIHEAKSRLEQSSAGLLSRFS